MIRVLIVDDHIVVRLGLRTLIQSQPDMEVAAEASNGREVVDMAAKLHPDVILLDLRMPECGGVETVRRLHAAESAARVLILSSFGSEEEIYQALVLGVRDYFIKCGFKSAVLGLSGGIDSALTAVLAVDALGASNVVGVSMPSQYSSQGSLADAEQLARNLGIERHVVPIQEPFAEIKRQFKEIFAGRPEDTTEENMQSRLRGLILMSFSNKFGHLLLTTGNKSELAVGYCTIYGDMCGGLAVISDVPKTMVYRLARWMNRKHELIPNNSITKPPSAELKPNQKDQDTLPSYEELDAILTLYVEERLSPEEIVAHGFPVETVSWVQRRVDLNEYKRRQAAPGLKVTSLAFGIGWRMPIAQRYLRSSQ